MGKRKTGTKADERTSTPLGAEKVVENIEKLPPNLRKYAKRKYRLFASGKVKLRHGSRLFAKRLMEQIIKARKSGKRSLVAKLKRQLVTPKDRRIAALMQPRVSYRTIEVVLGFIPNSGNDAFRQVDIAHREDKTGRLSRMVIKECKKLGTTPPPVALLMAKHSAAATVEV